MAEETLKLFLRFRDQEAEGVIVVDNRSIYLQKNAENRQLQLTGILHSTDDQDKVYQTLGKRGVEKFLEGYSSMFFLYGAPETGKTYTLLGDKNHLDDIIQIGGIGYKERGLIVRAMQQIFRKAKAQQKQKQFSIYCSCIEVSKIKISDLCKQNNKSRLRIQQNKLGQFTAVNLNYTSIKSLNQFVKYFKQILQLRQFTNSHLIFEINLVQQDIINKQQQSIQSYITFVQLGFITHNEQLEEQQQMLTQLNNLSLILSKIHNLQSIEEGFKQNRLTKILKQSITNSQNITIIGTVGKYNSYIQNLQTMNFLKIIKQPNGTPPPTRVLTVRKSRRSMKLKYQTCSNQDKDQTNSYGGMSSANTLKRRQSYLQITKQSGGYDRTQFLINQKMENQQTIKQLQNTLEELKNSNLQIDKKFKLKKDQINSNIASLKYTMIQLKLKQQNDLKQITQKYQKFLQKQNNPQTDPKQSQRIKMAAHTPSKRFHDFKHSLSTAKQQRKTIKNLLDQRDQRLHSARKQYMRQINQLHSQKNNMQLTIDPYKQIVYKQTLKQIKQLDKLIKSQQSYLRNITNQNIDKYQLMKILNDNKFDIRPYGNEIQKLLQQISFIKDTGLNNFKGKIQSYLNSQTFLVRTHKHKNSQSKFIHI